MISPQLQSALDYPSTLVYHSVYDGHKRELRCTDNGDLRSLRNVGEAMLDKVEKEEGGEWYLSRITRANGDFCSFPHPETI